VRDAFGSSQRVVSRVAPLLVEQRSADRAGALLRFVQTEHLTWPVNAHLGFRNAWDEESDDRRAKPRIAP